MASLNLLSVRVCYSPLTNPIKVSGHCLIIPAPHKTGMWFIMWEIMRSLSHTVNIKVKVKTKTKTKVKVKTKSPHQVKKMKVKTK